MSDLDQKKQIVQYQNNAETINQHNAETIYITNIVEPSKSKSINLPCPYISPNQFHGREKTLGTINKRIRDGEQITVVRGMGGVGKSYLARMYFTNAMAENSFDSFIWISCSNSLIDSLKDPELLTLLEISPSKADFSMVLAKLATLSNSLIVLD